MEYFRNIPSILRCYVGYYWHIFQNIQKYLRWFDVESAGIEKRMSYTRRSAWTQRSRNESSVWSFEKHRLITKNWVIIKTVRAEYNFSQPSKLFPSSATIIFSLPSFQLSRLATWSFRTRVPCLCCWRNLTNLFFVTQGKRSTFFVIFISWGI